MKEVKRYHAYAASVRSGRVLACEAIKKAVARFDADLARAESVGPWVFDEDEADRIIDFVEALEHFEEPYTGEPIVLEPWECFFLGQLYGWRNRETGRRRFRKAFLFVARKQGKTILASGPTLYELATKDGIEAYSLATKTEIADKVFRNLKAFIARNDELSELFTVYAHSIINQENMSVFKPLSKDAQLDGLNPAYAIIDELAAQRSGEAYNTLTSGMGTRSEALTIVITTAGYGLTNPGLEEYDYAAKVLAGTIEDDSLLALVYEYDRGDRWDDLEKLEKSCPNLGVSVPRSYFEERIVQAKAVPSLASEYKVKYCNLWQSAQDTWIPDTTWRRCEKKDPKPTADELAAAPSIIALDFSTIWDWTVATRYTYLERAKRYVAAHRCYIPEAQVETKAHLETPMLRDWIARGLVVATPGECIDYEYLYRDLDADLEAFEVLGVTYDPAKAKDFELRFGSRATIIPFIQRSANISPAAKAWEKAIVDGQVYDPSPVLRWMVSNAINKQNQDSGSYFITKSKTAQGRKRIDGVITSLMAFSVLQAQIAAANAPRPPVFDLSQIRL